MKKKAAKKGKVTESNIWKPNPKQIRIVELLNNPEDNRTKEDKCNEIGVTRKTLYEWLKKPEFVDYMNSQLDKYTNSALPDIWKAHIRAAKRGDIPAIKLYYEMKRMLPETKIKQEVSGPGGGPVETKTAYDFSSVPKDDLMKILETIQAAKKE
jgi:hypothetical protein